MFFSSFCLLLFFSLFAIPSKAKIPCDPESFRFHENKHVMPLLKFDLRIDNAEEIGCAINATYYWEIFRYEGGLLHKMVENPLLIKHFTKSTTNTIDFTKFKSQSQFIGKTFAIRVILIPRPTHYSSYRIHYFQLSPEYEPTMPGKVIIHRLGEGSLWLNASWEPKEPYNHGSIYWRCVPPFIGFDSSDQVHWEIQEVYLRPNRTYNCTYTVMVGDLQNVSSWVLVEVLPARTHPAFELDCIENCVNPDPFKRIVLKYSCYALCDGPPGWTLEPYDSIIQKKFKPDGQLLIIPPKTFDYGSKYKIIMSVDEETANYTVSFGMAEHTLRLDCIQNCYYRHLPITFKVFCNNCVDATYNWEILPLPNTWDLKRSMLYTPDDELTIEPFSFPPGTYVNLSVKSKGGKAVHDFQITGLQPKFELTCLKNCQPSTISIPIVVEATCTENCSAITDYRWSFEPPIPRYHWYENATNENKTITIPIDSFKPGDAFVVMVTGDPYAAPSEMLIQFADAPELNISCFKNCYPGTNMALSPYKAVILNVTCTGICKDIEYKWSVYPKSRNVERNMIENNTEFFIPADMYEPGDKVDVVVSGGGTEDIFPLEFPTPKPKIAIHCLQNCFDPANPNMDTVVQAVCTELCEEVNYKWDLEYTSDKPFAWYDSIILSFRNLTLTIRRGTFWPNDTVTLELTSYSPHATAYYNITFQAPTAVISLECIQNCNNSWTHLPLTLRAKCMENCDSSNFIWDFQPQPHNFKWEKYIHLTHTNSVFTLSEYVFDDGDVVTFSVSNRDAIASLNITFEEIPASLNLTCLPRPCNRSQNPKSKVEIIVGCYDNCHKMYYNWDLHPLPGNFVWDKNTIRDIRNETLVILPGAFSHNDNITVTAWVGRASAVANLIFRDPMPEMKVVCLKNCNHSNPHEPVYLQVNCEWLCDYVDIYQWVLNPPTPNFAYNIAMSPRHQSIIIHRGVYKDGDVVNVTAFWSVYNDTLMIAFVEPKPTLEIICLRNCEFNPAKEAVFEVACTANCLVLHNYSWVVTPGKKKPLFYSNNKVISFPAASYENYDKVYLTACQGKACHTAFVVFKYPKSELVLICSENCRTGGIANPKLKTKLKVFCVSKCDSNLSYVWYLDQAPILFNQTEDIKLDRKKEVLTIRPQLYLNETCILVNVSRGEGHAEIKICFIQPPPHIEIKCVQNCRYANPTKNVTLVVTCIVNCFNLSFEWTISPQPRDFSWEKNIYLTMSNITLTLIERTFQDKESALFTVYSGSSKAERLVIFAVPAPKLALECKPTCYNVSPRKKVVLTVKCLQYCENLFYLWDVSPKPHGFIWSLNISLSDDNNSLTINEETYQNLSQVEVMVVSNKSAYVMTKVYYFIPPEKLQLVCISNCKYDPKKPIVFELRCNDTSCTRYIDDLKCSLKPPSLLEDALDIDGLKVIVRPHRYESDEIVRLTCTSLNATAYKRIIFGDSPWNGKCALEPFEGESGKTLHAVDCISFRPNATYTVFQPYPGLKEGLGVALYHGKEPYMTDILFASSTNIINVAIGRKGEIAKVIKLKMNSISFLRPQPKVRSERAMRSVNFPKVENDEINDNENEKDNKIMSVTFYDDTIFNRRDKSNDRNLVKSSTEDSNDLDSDTDSTTEINPTDERTLNNNTSSYESFRADRMSPDKGTTLGENSTASTPQDYDYEGKDPDDILIEWEDNQAKELNRKLSRLNSFVRLGRLVQVAQMVFVMDQALWVVPNYICLHYRRHLLENLVEIAKNIHPLQVLTLLQSITARGCLSVKLLHLIMESTRQAVEGYKTRMKEGAEVAEIAMIKRINHLILSLSGEVLYKSREITDLYATYYDDIDYPDITQLTHHLRFITTDMIAVVEMAAAMLFGRMRKTRYENDHIAISMFKVRTDTLGSVKYTVNNSQSYLLVFPSTFTERREKFTITFKVIHFQPKLFWWDPLGTLNGDALYATAFSERKRKNRGLIRVHLHLAEPKKYKTAKWFLRVGRLKTWMIRPNKFSMLELIFVGNDILVSVSIRRPSREYTIKNGVQVAEMKRFYFFAENSPVYVGVIGEGEVSVNFTAMACWAWHGKKWKWSHEYCIVAPQSFSNFVICECTHLSVFSAESTSPDIIDTYPKRHVYPRDIKNNFIVIGISFFILLCMLAALLVAHNRDNRFRKRFHVKILRDNYDNEKERYLIVVQTGLWPHSGTTSRVAMQVVGSKYASHVHLLNFEDLNVLQRNNTDFFVMYTPKSLGKLKYLRVWHDSYGKHPSWYCDAVVIKHLPKGKKYLFIISRWFSLVKMPGTTQGRFRPKRKQIKPKFSTRFELALRAHHSYMGCFYNRYHVMRLSIQVIVSAISILCMMAATSIMIWLWQPLSLYYFFIMIPCVLLFGLVPSCVIDTLFRYSRT